MTQTIKERLKLLKKRNPELNEYADNYAQHIYVRNKGFNEGVDACLPLLEEVVREERDRIISQVESTIAEFEEQGIGVVAAILEESFHGKKEVEY